MGFFSVGKVTRPVPHFVVIPLGSRRARCRSLSASSGFPEHKSSKKPFRIQCWGLLSPLRCKVEFRFSQTRISFGQGTNCLSELGKLNACPRVGHVCCDGAKLGSMYEPAGVGQVGRDRRVARPKISFQMASLYF